MTKIHRKFRIFLFGDIEKEEAWINQQREKNLYLDSIPIWSILYNFREAQSSYVPITRIDFREFNNDFSYSDYLALYEDGGWEHIYGRRTTGLHYFRQDNLTADSKLYSDKSSRAQLYLRYCKYLATLFVCFLPIVLNLELADAFHLYTFKSAYLTPGLWELTGSEFWRRFIFETPFALMRVLGGWLLVIIICSFLLGSLINYQRYKKLEEHGMNQL